MGNLSIDELFYPSVPQQHWQMMPWERIALTGVLSKLRPKLAIEIGVFHGGSLSLIAQYAERVIAIDIDPEVRGRFAMPDNVDLRIGDSQELIPTILEELVSEGASVTFVLVDGDHSAAGVQRDINLLLDYVPTEPMLIMVHDSANPNCRKGVLGADWNKNPYVQSVECDFVPGQVIEHTVAEGRGEIWGGFAIALLNSHRRDGAVAIGQAAKTSIEWIHQLAPVGAK